MIATIDQISTDEAGCTVDLSWMGEHQIYEFDLPALGTLATGMSPHGGDLNRGWVRLDGPCRLRAGDTIRLLPVEGSC